MDAYGWWNELKTYVQNEAYKMYDCVYNVNVIIVK